MADIDSGKVKWTRLAALGLLLAGLAPVLMLGASFAFGLDVGEDLVFFLTTAAIAFVGAFLVWKFGTWSKFVGILAAVLVAMAMFWTAFGLAQPGSFFDFVPGVLVIPGALVAIGACIAALVARRKGNVTAKPEAGERMGIRVVLGVAVLAAVVSGALPCSPVSPLRPRTPRPAWPFRISSSTGTPTRCKAAAPSSWRMTTPSSTPSRSMS